MSKELERNKEFIEKIIENLIKQPQEKINIMHKLIEISMSQQKILDCMNELVSIIKFITEKDKKK